METMLLRARSVCGAERTRVNYHPCTPTSPPAWGCFSRVTAHPTGVVGLCLRTAFATRRPLHKPQQSGLGELCFQRLAVVRCPQPGTSPYVSNAPPLTVLLCFRTLGNTCERPAVPPPCSDPHIHLHHGGSRIGVDDTAPQQLIGGDPLSGRNQAVTSPETGHHAERPLVPGTHSLCLPPLMGTRTLPGPKGVPLIGGISAFEAQEFKSLEVASGGTWRLF